MSSQSVLVVGGGLAGLASAVTLADAGIKVQLVERRPHLGGRATSYTLPDGTEIDNCQHITLGCCTNLADFYRRVGTDAKVRFYDRLYFVDRSGRRSSIAASPLPPPLHMAPSFARVSALAFEDKRAIAKALLAIARAGGAPENMRGVSMLDWLHRMRQTPGAIERFWRVVLVSALDEELARTDARYGVEVFWKAFLASRAGYRLGIPSVPLAELYEGCKVAIERHGGKVRLRSGVRVIQMREDAFSHAVLDDGSEISAGACIVAVPHTAVADLFPDGIGNDGNFFEGLRRIRTTPITGVHFWFDRTVMREPFLTLLDHTVQWVFNKSLLSAGERSSGGEFGGEQYLQLVISASYDLVPKSRQEIIDLCRAQLCDVLPATSTAELKKATIVKEVHATFSPEPGIDRWRLSQQTPVKNLFLAGDWTRTGWPATMEGAVRSGYLAAEGITSYLGRQRQFLQPDLPMEGLSKWWARRREQQHSGVPEAESKHLEMQT